MTDKTNNTMSANVHLLLRVLILISTIVLIYFAVDEQFRHNIPATIVVLAVLIFIERCVSAYQCKEKNEDRVEGFSRTERLERLNAGRGKLGQLVHVKDAVHVIITKGAMDAMGAVILMLMNT